MAEDYKARAERAELNGLRFLLDGSEKRRVRAEAALREIAGPAKYQEGPYASWRRCRDIARAALPDPPGERTKGYVPLPDPTKEGEG